MTPIPDYQVALGLALNLIGGLMVAFVGFEIRAYARHTGLESIYPSSFPSSPPAVRTEIRWRWSSLWWIGWGIMILGYILQGVSAVGWSLIR
jgi:hypothetical protein